MIIIGNQDRTVVASQRVWVQRGWGFEVGTRCALSAGDGGDAGRRRARPRMSVNMNGKLAYRMELSRGDRMKVAQHEVPGWGGLERPVPPGTIDDHLHRWAQRGNFFDRPYRDGGLFQKTRTQHFVPATFIQSQTDRRSPSHLFRRSIANPASKTFSRQRYSRTAPRFAHASITHHFNSPTVVEFSARAGSTCGALTSMRASRARRRAART